MVGWSNRVFVFLCFCVFVGCFSGCVCFLFLVVWHVKNPHLCCFWCGFLFGFILLGVDCSWFLGFVVCVADDSFCF